MEQLEFDFPKPYVQITGNSLLSPIKTPRIGFSTACPQELVHRVLRAMSAGLITVEDYQGNKLKVKI